MRLRGLAAACCGALAAVAAQPAFGAAPPTYADRGGDAARGVPEITTLVVSNDDTGAIRFRINVANQPHLASDATLELFLDTDRNPATGDPLSLGAEYRLALDGANRSFDFGTWDGARFDSSSGGATAQVWYWSGVSITINRSDLGGTGALAFWVRATAGLGRMTDAAPDRGTWAYELAPGRVNPPDIDSFSYRMRPAAPRAGSMWELRVDELHLVRTPSPARPDRWSCAATLAGRAVRGSGPGACRFRIPPTARGKRFAVTITVAYLGEVVTGTLTLRVR
jgi:hypothetical protein